MKITPDQFDKQIKGKSLRMALIGMSNIGKSFRSRQLQEEKGFESFCVDTVIEKELGLDGIEAVARWMGPPNLPQYAKTEKRYLTLESKVMRGIRPPEGRNFVLDTTGSVIYLEPEVLQWLKKEYLIVHLAVVKSMLDRLTEQFFTHPKPVIWGGMFQMKPKESPEVAFRRCYPEWLKYRVTKYRELADIGVSGEISKNSQYTCDQFLEAIRYSLGYQPPA